MILLTCEVIVEVACERDVKLVAAGLDSLTQLDYVELTLLVVRVTGHLAARKRSSLNTGSCRTDAPVVGVTGHLAAKKISSR